MRLIFAVLAAGIICWAGFRPVHGPVPHEELHWYAFDSALIKAKEQNRVIVMDMYTDWCGWCKKMDATTFSDPEIVAKINERFIPMKFNAEAKDVYEYMGKSHTCPVITKMLLGNKIGYPTTMFLMPDGTPLTGVQGYFPAKEFTKILDDVTALYQKKTSENPKP